MSGARKLKLVVAAAFLAASAWALVAPMQVSVPSVQIADIRVSFGCGAPLAAVRRAPNPMVMNQNTPDGTITIVQPGKGPPTGLDPRCVTPARRRVGEGCLLLVGAVILAASVAYGQRRDRVPREDSELAAQP